MDLFSDLEDIGSSRLKRLKENLRIATRRFTAIITRTIQMKITKTVATKVS